MFANKTLKNHSSTIKEKNKQKRSWPLVCKQTIPTDRPQLAGEVSANFCG
jgi:hypothetical protein